MRTNSLFKLIAFIKSVKRDKATQRFIKHNSRVFSGKRVSRASSYGDRVVLMELNAMQSAHIAYSYLGNTLADKFDADIQAYIPEAYESKWRKIIFYVQKVFALQEFGVYKSFGASKFVSIQVSKKQKQHAKLLHADLAVKLRNKRDVEDISLNGVWIGDLIYDTYLKKFTEPTIDLNSDEFQSFLLKSIELFVFWQDYFKNNSVQAINVSHCVYNLAIPLRIAVSQGIPAYQATLTHIYRLNEKNLFAYNDFHYFRERFSKLPVMEQTEGLSEASRRINLRFSGAVGVDMKYSSKSAFGSKMPTKVIRESEKLKFLVATHCFFDSPHSYGKNLFPDFYEWLEYLGQLSLETDYEWYIKTHPDYLPGTMEIIGAFVKKYTKFSILPSSTSHHQIIDEGIDCALTVYGTIALEYAALGVPVINCSTNNPHINYNFNHNPGTIEEYQRLISGFKREILEISKEQVFEFYYMKNIFNTENIFFGNFAEIEKKLDGYKKQFSSKIYDEWLSEWSEGRQMKICNAFQKYINSGDFRMTYEHLNCESN